MTTLDERMTAFERLSLASKLDLLAREVFSQKYGDVFTPPCKWDFNNIQNFGGSPSSVVDPPVKVEKVGWVENRGGGKFPVEKDTWVEVEYRDGVKQVCQAMVNEVNPYFGNRKATSWTLDGFATDIVGYRVIPEEELHLYLEPAEESYKEKEIKRLRKAVTDLLFVFQFMQEGGQWNSLNRVLELAKTAVQQYREVLK